MESEDINNLENGICTSYEEGESPPILRRNLYRKSKSNIETTINIESLQEPATEQLSRFTLPASFCPTPVAETILEPIKGLPGQNDHNIPDQCCEGSDKASFSTLTHLTWFRTKSNDVNKTINISTIKEGCRGKWKAGTSFKWAHNLSNTAILAISIAILMIIVVIIIVTIAQNVTNLTGKLLSTSNVLTVIKKNIFCSNKLLY